MAGREEDILNGQGARHPWHKRYTLQQIRVNLLYETKAEIARYSHVDERSVASAEVTDAPEIRALTMAKVLRGVNFLLKERGLLKDEEGNPLPDLMVDDLQGFKPNDVKLHRRNVGGRPVGSKNKKKKEGDISPNKRVAERNEEYHS